MVGSFKASYHTFLGVFMGLRNVFIVLVIMCTMHELMHGAQQAQTNVNVLQGVQSDDTWSYADSDEWSYEGRYSPRQSPSDVHIVHVAQAHSLGYFFGSRVPASNNQMSNMQRKMQERQQDLAQAENVNQKHEQTYDHVMDGKSRRLSGIIPQDSLGGSMSVEAHNNSSTAFKSTAPVDSLFAHLVTQRVFSPTGSESDDVEYGEQLLPGCVNEFQSLQQDESRTNILQRLPRKEFDRASTKAVCGRDRTVEPGSCCCSSK